MEVSDLTGLPFFWSLLIAVVLAWAHLITIGFWKRDKASTVRFRVLLVFIAGSAISLGWAVHAAWVWNPAAEAEKRPVTGIADVPYSTCVVFGIPDAEAFADPKARKDPSTADELARLQQDPPGCVDRLTRWIRTDAPAQINVYGRADRRQLSRAARARVVSNESLAHARAKAVAEWIAGVTSPGGTRSVTSPVDRELIVARTHIDVAGVRYANAKDAGLLEQDRSVDIEAFWPRQLPINSGPTVSPVTNRFAAVGLRLNPEGMDPGVALAVLSLFVALSAYLATVGFFMRERASELKKRIGDVRVAIAYATKQDNSEALKENKAIEVDLNDKKLETETHLKLLPIADLPMIFAALFLALHLFFFLSTAWLRASVVLATYAGLILVMLHAGVWFKTLKRLFEHAD